MKLRETAAQDPKSRLCAAGAAALSDAELVGALVGSANIADKLLCRFGGLDLLARASLPDLVSLPGIGPAAASRLLAAVQLSSRLCRRRAASVKLDDASRIAALVGPEMRHLQQEHARVVLLDAKLQPPRRTPRAGSASRRRGICEHGFPHPAPSNLPNLDHRPPDRQPLPMDRGTTPHSQTKSPATTSARSPTEHLDLSRQFLQYANEFRRAAQRLTARRPFLYHPTFYCALHSIELGLKSHLALAHFTKAQIKALGHDLAALLSAAQNSGQIAFLDAHARNAITSCGKKYSNKCFEYPEFFLSTLPIRKWIAISRTITSKLNRLLAKRGSRTSRSSPSTITKSPNLHASHFRLSVVTSLLVFLAFPIYSQQTNTLSNLQAHPSAALSDAATALNEYAIRYETGKGVTKDITLAFKYYKLAAEAGLAGAQHNLALCYHEGKGVAKDAVLAFQWMSRASNGGLAEAQLLLGTCYETGDGTAKNPLEAFRCYNTAALQGLAAAQLALGICYLEATGTPQNIPAGIKWIRSAALKGCSPAQTYLGSCYYSGTHLPRDVVQAYTWLLLASANGEARANQLLPKCIPLLTQNQIMHAQHQAQTLANTKTQTSTNSVAIAQSPNAVGTQGTGFFVTSNGFLITCAHILRNARDISITVQGTNLTCRLIKQDLFTDLALLQCEGHFSALPVASSGPLSLGAPIFTIGFPNIALQGSTAKLSRGEIAGLKGIRDDPSHFQISAPIQPGNSGGALLDERGNVVGVVAGKLDERAAFVTSGALPENVNYAVKSVVLLDFLNSVPDVVTSLKQPSLQTTSLQDIVSTAQHSSAIVLANTSAKTNDTATVLFHNDQHHLSFRYPETWDAISPTGNQTLVLLHSRDGSYATCNVSFCDADKLSTDEMDLEYWNLGLKAAFPEAFVTHLAVCEKTTFRGVYFEYEFMFRSGSDSFVTTSLNLATIRNRKRYMLTLAVRKEFVERLRPIFNAMASTLAFTSE